MAFRVGDTTFVHADGQIRMIPEEGKAKGLPFTVRAAKSISCELGGKALALTGTSIVPVSIVLVSAEPVFSIGLDVMQVSVDLAEHVGDGYARIRYQIVTTFTRPGLASATFICDGCVIEKGFGFKSDAGGAPGDELSGKCRTIKLKTKGKTYDPFGIPGGVSLI